MSQTLQRSIAQVLASLDPEQAARMIPTAEHERKWYAIGYQLGPDRDLQDALPDTVPPSDWQWYALGVSDWKTGARARAWWTKNEAASPPPVNPSVISVVGGTPLANATSDKAAEVSVIPAVAGGAALGLGLVLLGVAWKRRTSRRR